MFSYVFPILFFYYLINSLFFNFSSAEWRCQSVDCCSSGLARLLPQTYILKIQGKSRLLPCLLLFIENKKKNNKYLIAFHAYIYLGALFLLHYFSLITHYFALELQHWSLGPVLHTHLQSWLHEQLSPHLLSVHLQSIYSKLLISLTF